MTEPRQLRIHLDPGLRQSAEAGQHNFISLVCSVARASGYEVRFCPDAEADRLTSAARPGYTLFHMHPPLGSRSLTFRRVYFYPFWAIERSARRWEWEVARARFDPAAVRRGPADRFFAFWQRRLFGDAPMRAAAEGFVYIPLQGRLLHHRSFQSCAPVDMIERVLEFDPSRPVIAALHPKETYSSAEIAYLDSLSARFPRLSVVTGQMERLLGGCDYVVSQNSAAAFAGYFFGKPAALFARIDFAHIAADATELGAEEALRRVRDMRPDYAGYVHWFWQEMSINAGRPDARDRIARRLDAAGWPLG